MQQMGGINKNAVGLSSKISDGSWISQERGANTKGDVPTLSGHFFLKYCLKIKQIRPRRGERPWRSAGCNYFSLAVPKEVNLCNAFVIYTADKNMTPSLGGLEPPTFRLTAERANRLRHRDRCAHFAEVNKSKNSSAWTSCKI